MRALEEALENFAGCAAVISHDRWFLDRIATHMLAFEGDYQLLAELNFKGSHESVSGLPVAALIFRPGNFRFKLEKEPGPVKIPSIL